MSEMSRESNGGGGRFVIRSIANSKRVQVEFQKIQTQEKGHLQSQIHVDCASTNADSLHQISKYDAKVNLHSHSELKYFHSKADCPKLRLKTRKHPLIQN
jgi:hypothetical protein